MTDRSVTGAKFPKRTIAWTFLTAALTLWGGARASQPARLAAAEDQAVPETPANTPLQASIAYLPFDAPAGMSQAVVVENQPLLHTRQLLPVDRDGNVVGAGALDQQIEQMLDNLDAVLASAGSALNKLVRANVYAIEPSTIDRVREALARRLDPAVRPALTAVLTPMPHAKAMVAIDAVAVAAEAGPTVALHRCEAVAGDPNCADVAVLPNGGVAYLSGVPADGGLTVSAVSKSMSLLGITMQQLQLSPAHIVQLKVFQRPAIAAEETLDQLKQFFPGQLTPPVVFVEWIAQAPVEIELIAQLPPTDQRAEGVHYYNPPEVRPAHTFSRVTLVRAPRRIYVSGLFARKPGRGEEQAHDVFEQLQAILQEADSDMLHLAKATYYVSDDDAARGVDRVRPRFFDLPHAPAASKVMVFGAGQAGRTLTMDMIAVGR